MSDLPPKLMTWTFTARGPIGEEMMARLGDLLKEAQRRKMLPDFNSGEQLFHFLQASGWTSFGENVRLEAYAFVLGYWKGMQR